MAKGDKSHHQRAPEHWDDVFEKQFSEESDRACVILAAALLDTALETLLKAKLVHSSASEDPLFEGANAPLGSFSSRIEMSYRVGIIDAGFARALHLVRRIRNDFAHNVTGCTFLDSAVMGRLTELRRATGLPAGELTIRKSYSDGPRGDFQMIVSWMQWMLRSTIEDTESIEGFEIGIMFEPPIKRGD